MKTKEELKALKGEVDALSSKLSELTEDELKQVTGGIMPYIAAFDPRDEQILTTAEKASAKKAE